MELNIKDRIYILQIFPKQGKYAEFNLKRGIIDKVKLTEKDREFYSIKEDAEKGNVVWDITKDLSVPLTVDFSTEEIGYLRKSCEALVDVSYPDDFWRTVEKIYDASNE